MFRLIGIILILYFGNLDLVLAQVSTIKQINGESDDNSSLISAVFQNQVEAKNLKIEEHGSFIQVSVSDAIISDPGKFYDGNSPFVRKVAAFQVAETTVGIRLFVTKDAASIMPALKSDFLGDRLTILIDHNKIATQADKAPFKGVPSVNEVIQSTEVEKNATDPVKATSESNGLSEFSVSPDQLKEKLIPIAIFSAIMLAGLLVLMTLRKLRMRAAGALEATSLTMKTLASYNLAPKQKITLIEIGGEKILLGVTPDQINYLTSIKPPESPRIASAQSRSQQILKHVAAHASAQKNAAESSFSKPAAVMKPSQMVAPPRKAKARRSEDDEQAKSEDQAAKSPSHKGQRVSYAIGDEGVSQVKVKARAKPSVSVSQDNDYEEPKSIEDVTNLIRRKLQDLPKIES